VYNYSLTKIETEDTTPQEIIYGVKFDYCNLVPMFSVAYIKGKGDVRSIEAKKQVRQWARGK